MVFIKIILLSIICFTLSRARTWLKLNTDPVCYSTWGDKYGEFESAIDADIDTIRLIHREGVHECDIDVGGYFGCEFFVWTLVATNDDSPSQDQQNEELNEKGEVREGRIRGKGKTNYQLEFEASYYTDQSYKAPAGVQHHTFDPTNQYDGPGPALYHYLYAFLTDVNNTIIAPGSPMAPPRYLVPGLLRPSWNSVLDITPNSPPYSFKQGEKYRMWYGEDLANYDEENNGGNMCIDILVSGKC